MIGNLESRRRSIPLERQTSIDFRPSVRGVTLGPANLFDKTLTSNATFGEVRSIRRDLRPKSEKRLCVRGTWTIRDETFSFYTGTVIKKPFLETLCETWLWIILGGNMNHFMSEFFFWVQRFEHSAWDWHPGFVSPVRVIDDCLSFEGQKEKTTFKHTSFCEMTYACEQFHAQAACAARGSHIMFGWPTSLILPRRRMSQNTCVCQPFTLGPYWMKALALIYVRSGIWRLFLAAVSILSFKPGLLSPRAGNQGAICLVKSCKRKNGSASKLRQYSLIYCKQG